MDALADAHLNLPVGYDSDDFSEEDTSRPPVKKHQGFINAQAIFRNAAENRAGSKKALKNHTSVAAAPGTNDNRSRWMNYFDSFMRTLGETPGTVPTGDHIYRFTWTIIRTIKPVIRGKPVASLDTIKGGLTTLVPGLIERYEGWKVSSTTTQKLNSLFNDSVNKGLLTKGKWRARQRLGFKTLLKLTEAWLSYGVMHGVRSWDVHFSKQLCIILLSAFAARAGDVVRTSLYHDMECLLFSHITLKFEGGDEMKDLMMLVSLKFVKGYKDLPAENRNIRVDILRSNLHNSNCPVKGILVQALRHGLVGFPTWEQLRQSTLTRVDRTIQWTQPDLPVVPAIIQGRCSLLNFNKPAGIHQPLVTLNQMSLIGRSSIRYLPHDIRRGWFAELAHLKKKPVLGVASMEIAAAGGHKMTTFMADTTGEYVGASDVDLLNPIAESDWEDKYAGMIIHTPFIPRKIPKKEKMACCQSKGWDENDKKRQLQAFHILRLEQIKSWVEAGKNALLKDIPQAKKKATPPLQPKSTNIKSKSVTRMSSAKDDDGMRSKIDPRLLGEERTASISTSGSFGTSEPILEEDDGLDDNVGMTEDEEDNAVFLRDMLTGHLGQETQDALDASNEAEDQLELLDTLEQALPISAFEATDRRLDDEDPIHSSHENFVTYFSIINTVRNSRIAEVSEEKFQLEIIKWIATGNSRGEPTKFRFYCDNQPFGCKYSATKPHKLEGHMRACKISADNLAREDNFGCRKPNCERVFNNESSRNHHEQEHDFQYRTCTLGCTDGKIFKSSSSWRHHREDCHDEDWDKNTTCMVTDCSRPEPFPTRSGLQRHLRNVHRLDLATITDFMPKRTASGAYRGAPWGIQICPIADCHRTKEGLTFKRRLDFETHLKSRLFHNLSQEEVDEYVDKIHYPDA